MKTDISSPFWSPRLQVNAHKAIFHQWEQLEASGCIENFRVAAGSRSGLHTGWFFADSDAYKWLEAAANCYAHTADPLLKTHIDDLISLIKQAQEPDGYIYTYNQINFPASRWENLLIDHELYCMGHFIEAAVAHKEATHESSALSIACRVADLLALVFLESRRTDVDGHEEIEIALLRLYQSTQNATYLDLASSFLERRGRVHPFILNLLRQNGEMEKRKRSVLALRESYCLVHPDYIPYRVPEGNYSKAPLNSRLRWMLNAMSGKYFQTHLPIRKQAIPVGHAVRFGYLATATAMLCRLNGDRSLLPHLEAVWNRMVERRMYITGGLGSVPGLEGFGRDYELDPSVAYAETCAALASLFWNMEMLRLTGNARYSDLLEWQLYNAASPGMGIDGTGYLYNNPLASIGGVTRQPWYAVPCCPSNLSRTWATLEKYIYSCEKNDFFVHQYIGSRIIEDEGQWSVEMQSALPWQGDVQIKIRSQEPAFKTIHLRLPSWAGKIGIKLNGEEVAVPPPSPLPLSKSGVYPDRASYLPISRLWQPGDHLDVNFELPVLLRRISGKVRGHKGKVAVTRGPLVYCLESLDNPGLDIFSVKLNVDPARSASPRNAGYMIPSNLLFAYSPDLLGGTGFITGKTQNGQPLLFIPYFLWANRTESQMTIWVNVKYREHNQGVNRLSH
jgi:uncharacterized protein